MSRQINVYVAYYRNVRLKTSAKFLFVFSFNVAQIDVATGHNNSNKASAAKIKVV